MSLESEIRTLWSTKSALSALLGIEKVTTGPVTSLTLPYVVMQRVSSRQAVQSTSCNVEQVELMFEIYHDDYSAASTLRDALVARAPDGFHNEAFTIDTDRQVLSMQKRTEKTRKDEETGTWIFEILFTILLQNK